MPALGSEILILNIRIGASNINKYFLYLISYISKSILQASCLSLKVKDVNVKKIEYSRNKEDEIFDLFDDKRVNF